MLKSNLLPFWTSLVRTNLKTSYDTPCYSRLVIVPEIFWSFLSLWSSVSLVTRMKGITWIWTGGIGSVCSTGLPICFGAQWWICLIPTMVYLKFKIENFQSKSKSIYLPEVLSSIVSHLNRYVLCSSYLYFVTGQMYCLLVVRFRINI